MNIDEGFFETAAKGKSKAGKLKDVCQDAYFFTDGYFDFGEKLWKSDGKVIDDSRWYKDDFRVYPVLLDRFAYVKDTMGSDVWISDLWFFGPTVMETSSMKYSFVFSPNRPSPKNASPYFKQTSVVVSLGYFHQKGLLKYS